MVKNNNSVWNSLSCWSILSWWFGKKLCISNDISDYLNASDSRTLINTHNEIAVLTLLIENLSKVIGGIFDKLRLATNRSGLANKYFFRVHSVCCT